MKNIKLSLLAASLLAGSTTLFAGGNIAPVAPIAPTPAAPASCDFWGTLGAVYEADDDQDGPNWGDKENNQFTTSVVLGVEKKLGYGFGIGAEVAGWSQIGLKDLGTDPAIDDKKEGAELSQLYLTYSFGTTAIKAGRMEVSDAVSPWAWSDRTANVIDNSYEGVVIANTSLADTTLVGAWIKRAYFGPTDGGVDISDNGLFLLSIDNKSITDTEISLAAYYVPDNKLLAGAPSAANSWSVWGTLQSKLGDFDTGLQLAYVDGDVNNWDATFGVAATVGGEWGDLSTGLTLAYINDGDYSLMTAGSGGGSSAFWSDDEFDGDTVGEKQIFGRLEAEYKLGIGSIHGSLAYWDYDDVTYKNAFSGVVGYEFEVSGVDISLEYAHSKRKAVDGSSERNDHITLETAYKF